MLLLPFYHPLWTCWQTAAAEKWSQQIRRKQNLSSMEDTSGFFGCITRPIDGLAVQRNMRDEWDWLSRWHKYSFVFFIEKSKSLSLTNDIKERTILIRRKYNIKLPDAIIAATALENDMVLITADNGFEKKGT